VAGLPGHQPGSEEISLDGDTCPHLGYVSMTFVSFQELMGKSASKSVFLHRERGVWDSSRRQKGLLVEANNQLAQKSTEAADL
jgi:hypothetical protein